MNYYYVTTYLKTSNLEQTTILKRFAFVKYKLSIVNVNEKIGHIHTYIQTSEIYFQGKMHMFTRYGVN